MKTYDEAMADGAAEYSDVLAALNVQGLAASFTQTGGMNAAIEVLLEAGYSLLITDASDSLSWYREAHEGWAVGLFSEEIDEGSITYRDSPDPSMDALLALVEEVLKSQLIRRNVSKIPRTVMSEVRL